MTWAARKYASRWMDNRYVASVVDETRAYHPFAATRMFSADVSIASVLAPRRARL
jgi:hypothetical protein